MRNRINKEEPDVINNQNVKQITDQNFSVKDLTFVNPVHDHLALELNEDFFNYVKWLGLVKEPGLIVLSSEHHYFYDIDDLKNINTVVNMMPLNKISNLKQFLCMIFNLIPHKCYFTGCFRVNNRQNLFFSPESNGKNRGNIENGILSKIPVINIINNFLDKKTNNNMSKINVTFMLENQGFKVLDMTELNGLIYFCSRKLDNSQN